MKDTVTIQIREICPDELSAYCQGLTIFYGCAESLFGTILVAYVPDGICYLSFVDDNLNEQLEGLRHDWPGAKLQPEPHQQAQTLLSILQETNPDTPTLSVCLSGTDLQRQVWKALLQVHEGETTSYTQIAQTVGRPKAVRAVASAIGKNPVSWIIPCHRILHKDGSLSGYRWNAKRKRQLLDWEKSK